MSDIFSFGAWVRRRRRTLDLTQAALAARVGVATITIQKIEADERRPSPQVAALLAEHLALPPADRERFLQAARAELAPDRLESPESAPPPFSTTPLPWAGGTMTFLMTDIVGSTRLWQQHPHAMAAALARHDALLDGILASCGGTRVKGTGDGVLAVFPRATDALAAAVAGQQALRTQEWGQLQTLPVRMALHTGISDERDGDYFGPTLNRVARLVAAGHGDQILLTATAYELVRDHLPEGLALRDLGTHQLKDLSRPEPIFQVVAPGLPAVFPPLRAAQATGNLPAPLVTLIGRASELDALGELLSRTRLITLTGPGGTGKTQLALAVARLAQSQYPDGVWFIDLSAVTDPTQVAPTIAHVLEVPELVTAEPVARLETWLREKVLLLVLDNVEQVIAGAPVVSRLLRAAPRLCALATSRIPLRVAGEQEVLVAPLALPPDDAQDHATLAETAAVQLFVQRAQSVRPGFALDPDNAPAVAAICRRLDGLPLAIELAAARVKLFSPPALLARLDASGVLPVLTSGTRDLPVRQQTLAATVAWSYDLLRPDERLLLDRCAVFAGGWTLEAAESVCGVDLALDVADGLATLVDHSLVKVVDDDDGAPHFAMLETVRAFALALLRERDEQRAVPARHAAYYLALAEEGEPQLRGDAQIAWLARLDAEDRNLSAALHALSETDCEAGGRLALALATYWELRGRWAEARAWLEQFDSCVPAQALHTRTLLAFRVADFALKLTDHEAGERALTRALSLSEQLGDERLRAHSLLLRGEGVGLGSAAMIEAALPLLRTDPDPWYLAEGLLVLAVHASMDNLMRFEALINESLVWSRVRGDRAQRAWLHFFRGCLAVWNKDFSLAASEFQEMRALQERIGTQYGPAQYFNALGSLALLQGAYDEAEQYHQRRLAHERRLGHRTGVIASLWQLGQAALARGDLESARERFTMVQREAHEVNDSWFAAIAAIELGYTAVRGGDQAGAAAQLAGALNSPVITPADLAYGLEGLALVAVAQGRPELGAQLLGCANALPRHQGRDLLRSQHFYQDDVVRTVRDNLAANAFATAYAAGQSASWQSLLDEVLAKVQDLD